jgi:HAMP domain-containing protein
MIRLNTIRSKLLAAFTTLFIIILGLVVTAVWFNQRRDEISKIIELLNKIQGNTIEAYSLSRDFLIGESISDKFYISQQSIYLDRHKQLIIETGNLFELLLFSNGAKLFNFESDVDSIKSKISSYELVFDTLVFKMKRSGFRDYGLEGEMRRYIHEIERTVGEGETHSLLDGESFDQDYYTDMSMLLMIRRHEKDFLLRFDKKYIDKLAKQVEKFSQYLKKKKDINKSKRNQLLSLLDLYQSTFVEMVKVEEEIGLSNEMGLKKNLTSMAEDIQDDLESIINRVNTQAREMKYRINIIIITVTAFGLGLIIILSFLITTVISKPVAELSDSINAVIQNNFSHDFEVLKVKTNDEISRLSMDFSLMLDKVRSSIEEVNFKAKLLQESNENIMASIRYAKTIQEAILPTHEELCDSVDDYFVIYRPEQEVSGDFYWSLRRKRRTWVAAVDCTGHGVPGAFMSMMGSALLLEIIGQRKVYDPAEILETLHVEIQDSLKQNLGKNTDGMDVCLCLIENQLHENDNEETATEYSETVKVYFSGAKRPLYHTYKGELMPQVKGTNRSIGGNIRELSRKFETVELSLQKGDILYLTTDGYADQPDVNKKKFTTMRLFELLKTYCKLPLKEQARILEFEIDKHLEGSKQRDDITVFGVRV